MLVEWLTQRGLGEGEAIAIDGNTLRGIHGETVPGVYLVSAFTQTSGLVLAQEATPGKGGAESAAAKAILARLALPGHTVTGDAELFGPPSPASASPGACSTSARG